LATAAYSLKNVSDYGTFGFKDFFKGFLTAWPAGLVMGIFTALLFVVVIPFYMNFESTGGLILAIFVFWITVFSLLSFKYYFTV
jgi:Mg/Co/Ni transporter MgtE